MTQEIRKERAVQPAAERGRDGVLRVLPPNAWSGWWRVRLNGRPAVRFRTEHEATLFAERHSRTAGDS